MKEMQSSLMEELRKSRIQNLTNRERPEKIIRVPQGRIEKELS